MSSSILEFATTSQIEINASCEAVWNKVHDVENFPTTFKGVYMASVLDNEDPRKVGSRRKVVRICSKGHCFAATWSLVRNDDDEQPFPRSCQFYSDDFVGPGKAVASTTWTVAPSEEDPKTCIVTVSMAIIPHSFFMVTGRLVFVPLMKKITRKGVQEDLNDLALACTSTTGSEIENSKSERTDVTDLSTESEISTPFLNAHRIGSHFKER